VINVAKKVVKEETVARASVKIAALIVFGLLMGILLDGFLNNSSVVEVDCSFTDIEYAETNESLDCVFSNAEDKCPLPKNVHCNIKMSGTGAGIASAVRVLDGY